MINLKAYHFISNYKKGEINNLDKKINIIYRNYNSTIKETDIKNIRNECKKSGKKFYVSNNFKLAKKLKLDGVYVPSFNKTLNLKFNNKKNFDIIGSAHNLKEIRIKELQNIQEIFLSPLFKEKINKQLNIYRYLKLRAITRMKDISLGGINSKNLKKLNLIRPVGFAGISYFE